MIESHAAVLSSPAASQASHSITIDSEYAPYVRKMLRSGGIEFTEHFCWFLWREFVVKGSPAVLLQVKRDVNDLQHAGM